MTERWPARWQTDAINAIAPYIDSEYLVEILVGDPATSIDGTLLADVGALAPPTTTAVHATHITNGDLALLAASGTGVCLCPTTERDLGDGIGPAARIGRGRRSAVVGK